MAAPAAAELYRWTSDEGTTHYTGDASSIPEKYRAAAVEIGHPAPHPAPPAPPAPVAVVVPFTGGTPAVVEARLYGVPLRLLLDTGADRTVIAPAALARVGIDGSSGTPVRITGVTGTALATLVAVPTLEVAGARVGPLTVIAYPVPGEAIDGLLGRDVLDAFMVTIDAAASRVTLTPR